MQDTMLGPPDGADIRVESSGSLSAKGRLTMSALVIGKPKATPRRGKAKNHLPAQDAAIDPAGPAGDEPVIAQVNRRPYTIHSLVVRPEQRSVLERVDAAAYPTFMRHTGLAPWWPTIYATFPEFQLILADARTGQHIAHGNLLPFAWDGTPAGLPHSAVEMVERALADRRRGIQPTVLGALQAVVDPNQQGTGLSVHMLQGMAGLAAAHRIPDLVAPIRPTEKALSPLSRLEEYVRQVRPDGLPIDPWQRVHARLGATPFGIEEAWLTVTASLDDWRRWTGVEAPPTGPYVVPGGLTPVEVDITRSLGRYIEPHLWMRYRIA